MVVRTCERSKEGAVDRVGGRKGEAKRKTGVNCAQLGTHQRTNLIIKIAKPNADRRGTSAISHGIQVTMGSNFI